jgi:NAD(P)-dependent dehydrogenase (short-subunit alcohol dehydrogenase family)
VQDLENRTIVISGVGPGLGRETALVATREGANVVLGARSADMLESVAAEVAAVGGHAVWRSTDIGRVEDHQRLIDLALAEFGQIDAIANIASMQVPFGGLEDAGDFSAWKQMFDINLYGTLGITRCALPALKRARGSVVFVSSQTQHHPPAGMLQMSYAASKAAITGAMRHLAREVGPFGVSVNEVAPGWMWGPAVEGYVQYSASERDVDTDVVLGELTQHMPLQRMATDGEVAETIVFMASPRAGGITGQILMVNAGELMR